MFIGQRQGVRERHGQPRSQGAHQQRTHEVPDGFDLVLDDTVDALTKYALVIVPNVECMSLDQIEGLIAYVAQGGSLFIGQDSAIYDLWHRRRIDRIVRPAHR